MLQDWVDTDSTMSTFIYNAIMTGYEIFYNITDLVMTMLLKRSCNS